MTWQIDAFLSHLRRLAPRQVIEEAGWRTRSNRTSWAAGAPIGIMAHHSASNPAEAMRPAVDRIINGWSGHPGPVYGSFVRPDGNIYLIAAGPANHAGQGIVAVRDRTRNGLAPTGNASAADGMNGNQWYWSVGGQHRGTYPQWPAVQVTGIVAVCAAFMLARGWNNANRTIHHREWTRRRIDLSYRGDLRGRTNALMSGTPIPPAPPTDWLDMDASTLRDIIRTETHNEVVRILRAPEFDLSAAARGDQTTGIVHGTVLDILRADEFRLDRDRRLQDDFRSTVDVLREGEFDVPGIRAATARTLALLEGNPSPTAAQDYPEDTELVGDDA